MKNKHSAASFDWSGLAALCAWVLLTLMVAALGWTGLKACSLGGLWTGAFARYCEISISQSLVPTDGEQRIAELTAEVSKLEHDLNLSPICEIANCPARNPAELAIILDTSGSMAYCQLIPRSLEQRLIAFEQAGRLDAPEFNALREQAKCDAPKRRIDLAQDALLRLTQSMSSNAVLSLTTFSGCSANTLGRFEANDRRAFDALVRQASADTPTALAAAFTKLSQTLETGKTEDAPASIIVLSDGGDTCGQDACKAARALKQARPFAYVHMLAIGGDSSVHSCIANATGGNVVDVRGIDDVASALRQLSGEASAPGCKKQQ